MKYFFRLVSYLLQYKLLIFLAVICSFIYAVMNGLSAYLIGPFLKTLFVSNAHVSPPLPVGILNKVKFEFRSFVDNILGSGDSVDVLTRLCIFIIVVIFFKNVSSYLQGYIMAFVEQGVIKDLREDIYISYHRFPLRFFQKRKTGDFISRLINDCNTINTNLNSSLIDLMKEPITISVILSFMIVISWKLTLLSFLIAPPSFFIIAKISKKLRRRTIHTQDNISTMTSVIGETISNIRVVKAFAMEQFEIKKFHKANSTYFRSLLKLFRMRRLSSPVTEILGVSMAVFVLWFGGRMVLNDTGLEPADFLTFGVMMFLLMQSAKNLSEVNVKMQIGIAASKRVFEIIDLKSDVAECPNPLPIETINDKIQFRNVWYEYEPGVPVLKDINLEVRTGEQVAIVGPSGGGKSTLVDLLPRFFDPVSGSVEIDGVDIKKYRLDDLRLLFGIVTQETILFHDTIWANIAYGRPDLPFEDVMSAARSAHAHDFIIQMEKGYETIIGERGSQLSGGQRQRIAIARAILKNPPILIFDEATSALDTESEVEVQSAIKSLLEGRTTFIIAHRLSTIHSATKVIVLDEGRIIEYGNHRDLYEKGGMYARLYKLQFAYRPTIEEEHIQR